MRIAILGATSEIAKDLVLSFSALSQHVLVLYARRPEVVLQWLANSDLTAKYAVANFTAFSVDEHFDVLINFVGVGNPAQAAVMGASIFDVTLKYDELALDYVRQHPQCRYIFLSSGAVYGSSFDAPVNQNTKSTVAINDLQSQDWYGIAKLYAECRHRALPHLSIVDVRVFNYFSHTQDMNSRFLITDIARAIRDNTVLKTSAEKNVRDYVHPKDFFSLIYGILMASKINLAVDCYSASPICKSILLYEMQKRFELQYEVSNAVACLNSTGVKEFYYSLNTIAGQFLYKPSLTSLEGITQEIGLFINHKNSFEK